MTSGVRKPDDKTEHPSQVTIPPILSTLLSPVGTKRFIRVASRAKIPIDKSWHLLNNQYFPHDPELTQHLAEGGNYGIGGGNGLVIIDIDDPELNVILAEKLPPTLEVTSPGSKLPHRYYMTDLTKPLRLRNKEKKNIGDVQGPRKQALGPGSIHPNGGRYELTNAIQPAFISEQELTEVLKEWLIPKKILSAIEYSARTDQQRLQLDITKVLNHYGLALRSQGQELYGAHPIHGSTGNQNFWVNPDRNVWHCFRCDTGGGSLSLIAILEKIIPCEEATPGGLQGGTFWEVISAAAEKGLINKEQLADIKQSPEDTPLRFFEQNEKGKWTFAPKKLADWIRDQHLFLNLGLRGKFYSYWKDQGIWKDRAEDLIRYICTKNLAKKRLDPRVREVVSMIREDAWKRTFPESPTPHKRVMKNGVLNLKNGELTAFDPLLYAKAAFPILFDTNAECPHILKFLEEITSDSQDLTTLQQWFGYHLLVGYPFHKALMLIGDGANGKTTLLNLLEAFVGSENCSYVEINELVNDRFAAADLFGKIANIADDISPNEITKTGKLKKITGESPVRVQFKNVQAFNYHNKAKASFSANKLPATIDLSYAFFRRWLLLKFNNVFEGENCDPHLLKKLTTPEELSGLLLWALKGLEQLLINNGFTLSTSAKETQADWKIQSNPIAYFIHVHITTKPEGEVPKWEIYSLYLQFCEEYGFKPLTDATFGKKLRALIPVLKHTRKKVDVNQVYYWVGIELKELSQETPPSEEDGESSDEDEPAIDPQQKISDSLLGLPGNSTSSYTFRKEKYIGEGKETPATPATPASLETPATSEERGEELEPNTEKGLQITEEFLQRLGKRKKEIDQKTKLTKTQSKLALVGEVIRQAKTGIRATVIFNKVRRYGISMDKLNEYLTIYTESGTVFFNSKEQTYHHKEGA